MAPTLKARRLLYKVLIPNIELNPSFESVGHGSRTWYPEAERKARATKMVIGKWPSRKKCTKEAS